MALLEAQDRAAMRLLDGAGRDPLGRALLLAGEAEGVVLRVDEVGLPVDRAEDVRDFVADVVVLVERAELGGDHEAVPDAPRRLPGKYL